jgi:hypothetical protein
MTAQINDSVFHRKAEFNIAGISGSGLFEPKPHGVEPFEICTACYRGYYVEYAIDDGQLLLKQVTVGLSDSDHTAARAGRGPQLFGLPPRYDQKARAWAYDGLRRPVAFSGGLLLGADFIQELYVHMGFHPAWKYREVREILFEQGLVTDDFDRSAEMQMLRDRLSEQPLQPGSADGNARIVEWIQRSFSRDYTR